MNGDEAASEGIIIIYLSPDWAGGFNIIYLDSRPSSSPHSATGSHREGPGMGMGMGMGAGMGVGMGRAWA